MGVPKFYRWTSERYPCLSEVVKENQIPEFDNLYLDMNGIIHQCSHPDDDNPHFRITEEKIFADIFHYIEFLFRIIKPRKVFFMAVDGVAPRAKMNQQRGRRFRSAREAEESQKKALEKGEVLPTEERFDSNCITPGTHFMVRLNEQLKYFVNKKITTDRMWQGIRVYLSGHESPGEGEHKIMEFIRYEKSRPEYDANTRHCLYGLDADLIMLGLTSHEPHFSLLREEVKFGGKKSQKRISVPEEITFHLLHLSLMREYLDFEFQELKDKLSFGYDLERIIDDWVLMGFLVGNDFIPHLPNLHIHHSGLPLLYRTYINVMPTLDGYLNEGGTLNLQRFEKFLEALAAFDREHFREIFSDLNWLAGKTGGAPGRGRKSGARKSTTPQRANGRQSLPSKGGKRKKRVS
ncbi:5'-3' exoribonuclease 1-like, partial [Branchiostoma floridae]|uniref:5'-3' exoribonuclease 1-like n=1 Tax=Branchiostoma floridae TaxID=7739 RepID=A0A9J7KBP0_BRAFL